MHETRVPHSIIWRRIDDKPGHEFCRISFHDARWLIAGSAVFLHEGEATILSYAISCDQEWRSISAAVSGWIGELRVECEISASPEGVWRINGTLIPELEGCVDLDLAFSPSTNLIPIRRLALEVGESAEIRSAWLMFPEMKLEPLVQTYTRIEQGIYRYECPSQRTSAEVRVNDAGAVVVYPKVWQLERAHT
jgi:hypothetical protein